MSQPRATALAVVSLISGSGLLIYLLRTTPPYTAEHQLNPVALLAFLVGVFLAVSGAAALVALALHRRWPALAYSRARPRKAASLNADPALRQGILVGIVVVTLIALNTLRVLDVAVLIVTLLVAGLIEAFVQSRK